MPFRQKEEKGMGIKLMVGEREVQLGWEAFAGLVMGLPNEEESLLPLFHDLARSNIAGVRRALAYKSTISEETVAFLATDEDPEVIEALVMMQRSKMSEVALIQIIQRNWNEVNRDIAENVQHYAQCDIMALAKLLAGNADPSVRAALAANGDAPKLVVRQLLKDPDPEVRRNAQAIVKRGW